METENNKKAKVIAFLNEKGGVGKTTTTMSVGAAIALQGKDVLLVDLDPQCSLTLCFGVDNPDYSTADVFMNEKATPKFLKMKNHLWFIPSSIEMAIADLTLSNRRERERILQKFLARISRNFDYILLDCPPYIGMINTNVIYACDVLLVPTMPELLALKALQVLADLLKDYEDVKPTGIDGIIATRYNGSIKSHRDCLMTLRIDYGDKVLQSVIRQNIDLAKIPEEFKTIFEISDDKKTACNGAEDYFALSQEIMELIEKKQS